MSEHQTTVRRLAELSKLIDIILEKGSPVSVADGDVETSARDKWPGHAMPGPTGTQYITLEARATGYTCMVVGKIDMVVFQLLLAQVKPLFSCGADFNKRFATVMHNVAEDHAKHILVDLPCGVAFFPTKGSNHAKTVRLMSHRVCFSCVMKCVARIHSCTSL